ncbi:MAG: CPBP family intramembrane metalloprotease [Brevinematales bacterium]|nr:CPBP family intramembrane metalloprotease [Brevinematales bacterium]
MSRRLIIFLLISFTFSWSIALLLWISGIYSQSEYRLLITLLLVAYMLGPAVGAIISQRLSGGKVFDLGIRFKFNTWWILGIFSVLLIVIINILIATLMGSGLNTNWEQFKNSILEFYKNIRDNNQLSEIMSQFDKIGKYLNYNIWILYLIILLSGTIAGISINAIAAFGEELGWRGLLFEEFKRFGFIKSSLITGLIWGVWHAPIIVMGHNFPNHPFEGIFLMIGFCIVFSFVMNYFREKSGSVVLSSMMHGVLNGTAGISIYANTLKNDILYNTAGISGIISVLLIIFVISISSRLYSKTSAT